MSESKITSKIVEQIRSAVSLEEIRAILKKVFPNENEPRVSINLDQAALVTGGTGRIPLNDEMAEKVVGGGHNVRLADGQLCWIDLHDNGYKLGTNNWCDIGYMLEEIAMTGTCTMDELIGFAETFFNVPTIDIALGIKVSGPAYVADGLNNCQRFGFTGY